MSLRTDVNLVQTWVWKLVSRAGINDVVEISLSLIVIAVKEASCSRHSWHRIDLYMYT
jgi:hypothetical protein